MMIVPPYYVRGEIFLRRIEILSLFKILKYSFEVRDINADFLKDYYLFLRHFDDEKV